MENMPAFLKNKDLSSMRQLLNYLIIPGLALLFAVSCASIPSVSELPSATQFSGSVVMCQKDLSCAGSLENGSFDVLLRKMRKPENKSVTIQLSQKNFCSCLEGLLGDVGVTPIDASKEYITREKRLTVDRSLMFEVMPLPYQQVREGFVFDTDITVTVFDVINTVKLGQISMKGRFIHTNRSEVKLYDNKSRYFPSIECATYCYEQAVMKAIRQLGHNPELAEMLDKKITVNTAKIN